MTLARDQERVLEEEFANEVERSQIRLVMVTKVYLNANEEPWVEVKPIYQRKYLGEEGEAQYEEGGEVWDVPVLYHSNQKYANWSSPSVDDTGILIQTDSAFDQWWETGDVDIEPNNPRKRNRTDGFFIPAGWAKPKGMGNASDQWHEMRNMENTLRIAMSNEEGVHLQDMLWHLILRKTGFDVYAVDSISLMDTIIAGFTASMEGFAGLAADPVLTVGKASSAAAAAQLAIVIAELEIIKGESQAPERDEAFINRP